MKKRFSKTMAVLAGLAAVVSASADPTRTRLLPTDPSHYGKFGSAVALSGDTVVAGVDQPDFAGASVHVFVKDGDAWTFQQKLVATTTEKREFGGTVAVDGDTLVIGQTKTSAAGAHVYRRTGTTWALEQVLHSDDPASGDDFGSSIALQGDTVLIGAPTNGGGAAWAFTRAGPTWTLQQKIVPTAAGARDFGWSVALDGDTAVVGAPRTGTNGAAYVFKRSGSTWTQQAKLAGDNQVGFPAAFGEGVGVSGDYALVGAPDDDIDTGAAYVFRRVGATWSRQTKLLPGGHSTGETVAIDGDRALVGSPAAYADSTQDGNVFVYTRTGSVWSLTNTLKYPDVDGVDMAFGRCLALEGARAAIGAPLDREGATRSGSVSIIEGLPAGGGGSGGGGENTPPVFARPIVPSANPAVAGKKVVFAAPATDADKRDRVAYEWNFGHGAAVKAAAKATHAFPTPGNYDVFARATDGKGGSTDSGTATIVVVAAGTPYFDVAKASVALKFNVAGKDKITVSGQLPLADGTDLAGKVLAVDFGGVAAQFTMSAKGKSPKGASSASVGKPKNGVAKFTATIAGTLAASLVDEGMTNATVADVDATTHVVVTFDGVARSEDFVMIYAGKAGRSGAAK